MSQTQTIYINLQRLRSCGDTASIIIRLMMACNDISLANQCLSKFKEDQPSIRKHVQQGALMYFVRLQCGHLNEAMKIIQEIKDAQNLCVSVKLCSQMAQDSFNKLTNCLQGGPDYCNFQKYIGRIRQNTAFHYDGKLADRALSDRSNRPEASLSKITRGDHISLLRFELADDIIDSIVCRQIWEIPRNVDLRQEADRIAYFGSELCRSFLNFCVEFIFQYIQEYAAI
ncbi:MAG TPA: hypothetical protein ACFYD6_03885 [Candidatus Brocadiia bacterium]|nr:hypothetical protein [Candidatus Brocadiales bacterium]